MLKMAHVGFAIVALLAIVSVACSDDNDGGGSTATPGAQSGVPTVTGQPTTTSSGLQIIDIEVGTGDEATAGSTITVNYTGYLEDGTVFGTSVGSTPLTDQPLSGLILGWQEGIPGMKEGGKRRLIIPPDLAYGEEGRPPAIPGNATITFDIELLDTQ